MYPDTWLLDWRTNSWASGSSIAWPIEMSADAPQGIGGRMALVPSGGSSYRIVYWGGLSTALGVVPGSNGWTFRTDDDLPCGPYLDTYTSSNSSWRLRRQPQMLWYMDITVAGKPHVGTVWCGLGSLPLTPQSLRIHTQNFYPRRDSCGHCRGSAARCCAWLGYWQ